MEDTPSHTPNAEQELMDEFKVLLVKYEYFTRQHEDDVSDEQALKGLEKTDAALINFVKELYDAWDQTDVSYQDIATSYFNFIEKVETQLGMTGAHEVDEQAILDAIKVLQGRPIITPQDGPCIQGFTPKPCKDPNLLLVMAPVMEGEWVRRKDHQWSTGCMVEAHKAEMEALKQELHTLREAAIAYTAFRPSEGSAARHTAFKTLKGIVEPDAHKSPSTTP